MVESAGRQEVIKQTKAFTDMQSCLHCEPGLVEQYYSILSANPTQPLSPEPLIFIQDLLLANTYPSCRKCSICLMNQKCLYQDSQLLCQKCAATHIWEFTSAGYSISGISSIDLSQKLDGSRQWSVGDHLELKALLERRSRQGKGQLLKLGETMFNKKNSLQVLQYIREKIDKNTSISPYQKINQCTFIDQELDIKFDCLNQQNDHQKVTTAFQRYKTYEDSTVRYLALSSNTAQPSKFIDTMALYQTQISIKIYKQILRLHKAPIRTNQNFEGIQSTEKIEDITSTNEVSKNLQTQSDFNCLKEKQLREQQLLNELKRLKKKGNAPKKKKISKERSKYRWQ